MDDCNVLARVPPQYHKLIDTIGQEATKKLCEAFGGDSLYIPLPNGLCKAERTERIIAEWNGENARALAKKYGITMRMVQYIVQDVIVTPNGNRKRG